MKINKVPLLMINFLPGSVILGIIGPIQIIILLIIVVIIWIIFRTKRSSSKREDTYDIRTSYGTDTQKDTESTAQKIVCTRCKGSGWIYRKEYSALAPYLKKKGKKSCPNCFGKGYV